MPVGPVGHSPSDAAVSFSRHPAGKPVGESGERMFDGSVQPGGRRRVYGPVRPAPNLAFSAAMPISVTALPVTSTCARCASALPSASAFAASSSSAL